MTMALPFPVAYTLRMTTNSMPRYPMRHEMHQPYPPNDPNAVSAKEKIEIVAYLLKEDGFPAGAKELPATLDELKTIKFEATKPGR